MESTQPIIHHQQSPELCEAVIAIDKTWFVGDLYAVRKKYPDLCEQPLFKQRFDSRYNTLVRVARTRIY